MSTREETEEKADFELTFAEFQLQQGVQQAHPVLSSIPSKQSAEAEKRPPPPYYETRRPASPYT